MPTERCTECGRTRAAHESYEVHQRTRGLAYHNWNSHGYWTEEQRRGLEVHYEHSGDEHMGDKDWPQRWAFGVTDREVLTLIGACGALLASHYPEFTEIPEEDEAIQLMQRLLEHRTQRQASDVRLQEELEK